MLNKMKVIFTRYKSALVNTTKQIYYNGNFPTYINIFLCCAYPVTFVVSQ